MWAQIVVLYNLCSFFNNELHLWATFFVESEITILSQAELETDNISKKNVKNKCYGNKLPMI